MRAKVFILVGRELVAFGLVRRMMFMLDDSVLASSRFRHANRHAAQLLFAALPACKIPLCSVSRHWLFLLWFCFEPFDALLQCHEEPFQFCNTLGYRLRLLL